MAVSVQIEMEATNEQTQTLKNPNSESGDSQVRVECCLQVVQAHREDLSPSSTRQGERPSKRCVGWGVLQRARMWKSNARLRLTPAFRRETGEVRW